MKKRNRTRSLPEDHVATTKIINGSEKIKRICNQNNCNKVFIATNKYIRTCPHCKKKNLTYLERSDVDFYSICL